MIVRSSGTRSTPMISQGVVPVSIAACASFVLGAFRDTPRMNAQSPSCVRGMKKAR